MICYIYLYLKSRRQCVSVNNINSTFKEIISRIPQGSVVGLFYLRSFSITFSVLYLFALAHNFADDNTLSSFAKTIENPISVNLSKNEIAISWFIDNHMIILNGKFQVIISDKHEGNHTNQIINTDEKEI